MTTPQAKSALATLIALSTKDNLHQLQPGLERLYKKINPTPYSPEPEPEPKSHPQAVNPENSTTKVQEWISDVEPVALKKNRRQRAKASKANAEAKAAESATSKDSEVDTKASSTRNTTPAQSTDDKPKGWKASLTIADIKAQKEEEARRKHEVAHTRREEQKSEKPERQATQDQQIGKCKARQAQNGIGKGKDPYSQGTSPSQHVPQTSSPNNNNNNNHGAVDNQHTIIEQPQIAQSPHSTQSQTDRPTIQFMHQQPLPPCGIPGCPVKAPHERRAYGFKERKRPSFVKLMQGKMKKGTASEREIEKVGRFFRLHGGF